MTEGGAIHQNTRQWIRPARTCVTAAVAAATPETPMFAPAPAAGLEEMSSRAGRRMFPSTRPTSPPASAVTKHHAATAASASACRATRVEYQA